MSFEFCGGIYWFSGGEFPRNIAGFPGGGAWLCSDVTSGKHLKERAAKTMAGIDAIQGLNKNTMCGYNRTQAKITWLSRDNHVV